MLTPVRDQSAIMFELGTIYKSEVSENPQGPPVKPTYSYAKIAVMTTSSFVILGGIVCFVTLTTSYRPDNYLQPILPGVDQHSTIGILSICCSVILLVAAIGGMIVLVLKAPLIGLILYCASLGLIIVLILTTLVMIGSAKLVLETNLEQNLINSLKDYDAGSNIEIYTTWNLLQQIDECCAVRTNRAGENYASTPWYMSQTGGSPHSRLNIPLSCCKPHVQGNRELESKCQRDNPLPSQNPNMNREGCFETIRSKMDSRSGSQLGALSCLLILCLAAFACTAYSIYITRRQSQT